MIDAEKEMSPDQEGTPIKEIHVWRAKNLVGFSLSPSLSFSNKSTSIGVNAEGAGQEAL